MLKRQLRLPFFLDNYFMKQIFFLLTIFISFQPVNAEEREPYATENRMPCEVFVKDRMPLFGDLHVHTALSLDANTQGTLNTPDDAYRYAKGQSLFLQPYKADGTSVRKSQLNQPLDFAAVSMECCPVPHPAIKMLGASTSLIVSSTSFSFISSTTLEIGAGFNRNPKFTHLGYGLTSY